MRLIDNRMVLNSDLTLVMKEFENLDCQNFIFLCNDYNYVKNEYDYRKNIIDFALLQLDKKYELLTADDINTILNV